MRADLVCPECAEERSSGLDVTTRQLCSSRYEGTIDEWGDSRGVRGAPQVIERLQPLDEGIESTELNGVTIADIAVARDLAETTFVLSGEGIVLRVRHVDDHVEELASVQLPAEPAQEPWAGHESHQRLHVSHDGAYAAVATDFGRFGSVVDTATGQITMELDGGDYHPETVPFSLVFAAHEGRTVLIHRTAWNRLDVSDPTDGSLLTERGPTSYSTGEERPPNYLDYFHGRLFLSPSGDLLLNDGWVWHPVGIPVVWGLGPWLSDNVWESENGASVRHLSHRDYYWNHGFCWLDERRIAVEGIGDDDLDIVPGVRIFDVSQPDRSRSSLRNAPEVGSFAGPAGRFFTDGDRLFSSSARSLSVWDIAARELAGRIEQFEPTIQSSLDRTLVEATGSTIRRWRY